MKTKLMAALLATAFAAPAFAQTSGSSVVIYGIADAGVMVSNNGDGAKTRIASGISDGSRIGFKGTEDLGDGWKAIFNLEARVELDTGGNQPGLISTYQGQYLTRGMEAQFRAGGPGLTAIGAAVLPGIKAALQPRIAVNTSGAIFDRTAMVGLITPVGAVLMGRMYTPGYEVFNMGDAFESGMATWGAITGGTGGFTSLGADIRSDKAIQYRVAVPSGWGGSLMYGVDKSGYLGLYKRFIGFNVTYKANGFDAGFGYNSGQDSSGRKSLTTSTLAGSYTNGNMKYFAGYHRQRNMNSALLPTFIGAWDTTVAPGLAPFGAAAAGAARSIFVSNITRNTQIDADSVSVGMHYGIGQGRVMTSLSFQNDKTTSNSDAAQFAIGYDHNLSKRTDVYTTFTYIRNKNDAQYAAGTAGSPGGFTFAPGEDSTAIQVGVRHRF